MYQQLWGYRVEEKLYLGVREQKRFNTTAAEHVNTVVQKDRCTLHTTRPIVPYEVPGSTLKLTTKLAVVKMLQKG
jgi:hypothetical protein